MDKKEDVSAPRIKRPRNEKPNYISHGIKACIVFLAKTQKREKMQDANAITYPVLGIVPR